MALRLSTGLVNKLMDTGSLKSIFNDTGGASNGFYIDIYTGVQPAASNDVATGTLVATVSVSGGATGCLFEASATEGELEKNSGQTWQGTALASTSVVGAIGWFRIYPKGTNPAILSTTDARIDGNVGTSNANMTVGSTSITTGAPFLVATFALTMPKA